MALSGRVTFYSTFEPASLMASQKDVYKVGRDLFGRVKSNWASESRTVKAIARLGPSTYRIQIGTTGRAHLMTHLIEFGGGRHTVRAPTRRAIDAAGLKVTWGEGR